VKRAAGDNTKCSRNALTSSSSLLKCVKFAFSYAINGAILRRSGVNIK